MLVDGGVYATTLTTTGANDTVGFTLGFDRR